VRLQDRSIFPMLAKRVVLTSLLATLMCYTFIVSLEWRFNYSCSSSPHAIITDKPYNVSKKPAILFIHFQKSAGSSVCEIMSNQVNMTDMMGNVRKDVKTTNCNVEVGGPRDNARFYHTLQTCRLLEMYTTNDVGDLFQRNNFIVVEVPFQNAMPCPGFRSFAVMREPVARFTSLMRFSRLDENKVLGWINKTQRKNPFQYMEGYPMVNNMVIRQLLGRDRFLNETPVDMVDLEKAKIQLDAFDAFVPLEYLENEKVMDLLRRTIPEYHEGLTRRPVVANENLLHKQEDIDPAFLQKIADENVYDTMLYQYMLEKLGIIP